FMSMFVIEMKPGAATAPQRHLYEETIYVLAGYGSTKIVAGNGKEYVFEWDVGSLFVIPLNATFRHFNGSGVESARMVCSTTAPAAFNMFHSEAFVFDNPCTFPERMGEDRYFNGDGDYIPIRPGLNIWETNFVPDLRSLKLTEWSARGVGSMNINLIMA